MYALTVIQRGLGEMSKAVKEGDFEQVKLLLEIGAVQMIMCHALHWHQS